MHCHSTASAVSRLGVQRALGLPECATPPAEVYELAKRRGMDFVTITDHDTIAGALEIADHEDAFISEELTARFRGEPQAVHVLCYGISPGPRVAGGPSPRRRGMRRVPPRELDRLRARSPVLRRRRTATPAPPSPTRRAVRRLGDTQRLARTRAQHPAAIYVETNGGTAIGGSDDHAGVDIGRTFTRRPAGGDARTSSSSTSAWAASRRAASRAAPEVGARGDGPDRARARPRRAGGVPTLDPVTCSRSPSDCCARGIAARATPAATCGRPTRERCCAPGSLRSGSTTSPRPIVAYMQDERFTHADLYRRASRAHERLLRGAVGRRSRPRARRDRQRSAPRCSTACLPAIPYAPSAAFIARERAKLVEPRRGDRRASRSSPTGSARCTASHARSRRSATVASTASRSRSSGPTRTSTVA